MEENKLYALFADDHEYGYNVFVGVFDSKEEIIETVTKEELERLPKEDVLIEIRSLQSHHIIEAFDDYVVNVWKNKYVNKLYRIQEVSLNTFSREEMDT